MSNLLQKNSVPSSLSSLSQWGLAGLAFFLVAFGQPAWLPWNGLLAAVGGYALFFRVLIDIPSRKKRFGWAFLWFFAVQLVQMSWFLSHPFWYIYSVYLFIATWLGLQFGCIGLLIRPQLYREASLIKTIGYSLFVASLWTVLEWSRLFFLSGLSWNPIGLALTGNLYALQMASLWGIFGLSFWVMFVNLLILYIWVCRRNKILPVCIGVVAAIIPYLYGVGQIALHKEDSLQHLSVMLVQPAFPIEKTVATQGRGIIQSVMDDWHQILQITAKHQDEDVDLIVLPEYVVSFGTYSFVYPLHHVMAVFMDVFHTHNLDFLPTPDFPFAAAQNTVNGPGLFVNNAYWMQALSNYFHADVIAGLEDAEEVSPGVIEHYSTAQFTHPQDSAYPADADLFTPRYAKRVLVPMGEYIPFSFCKKLAERYGVFGSFTCGQEAVIMTSHGVPFSPSICYEETFGDLIREGRQKGARLLVNLTSDVWYPDSRLPQQHFDHARLRTVENGVPLIRACNTGITAAVDSFGRTLAAWGGEHPEDVEWIPGALIVNVPIDTYETPYARLGDKLIVGICLLIITIAAAVGIRQRGG